MKSLLFYALTMAFLFNACTSDSTKTKETKTDQQSPVTEPLYACSMHPEVIGKKGEKCPKCGMELSVPVKDGSNTLPANNTDTADAVTKNTTSSFSVEPIINNYLKLKNALANDDSKSAAASGNSIQANLTELNTAGLSAEKKKQFEDVAEITREHAKHIGDNAGKLEHQREHFALLSKDVNDLITAFGSSRKLYLDFCPMYNNNKGANWISESKEIKNPYYGKAMLTCGSVKKEL